ncbi:TPA: hypothetical protein DDZ86_03670 [Candidatus Dependentiae bacterium]|nr:MAG: hypothetical protein UW09_C0003G0086 [candidate division TM6 bacterium GW2011_GWF2_43_87]HBL98714.1 hypothetical protein [Candidatus Dependentiae bacterium]
MKQQPPPLPPYPQSKKIRISAPTPQKTLTTKSDSFTKLIDQFIEAQDVAISSKKTYKSALLQFFVWFEKRQIAKPTRETILEFKEWLDKKGLQPFTRANYLVAVRRFFEWAEGMKYYPNIAKGIKGARRLIRAHQKSAFALPQIQKILNSINQDDLEGLRDYALINLLFRTGLRLIEIKRALVSDLEAHITVQTIVQKTDGERALLWVRGKGRDGKDDFVVVTADALTPLVRYLEKRILKSSNEPLFASLSDRNWGKALTTNSLSRLIKKRLRYAGFDSKRLTAHSLRHTFGVMAISAGASLYEVQLAMRHTAPATTEIYLGDIERTKRQEGGPEQLISALMKSLVTP